VISLIKVISEKLKKIYDYIVIDNPPVGLVTDGIPILQKADYPIYVFKANYSRKKFVQNVKNLIKENDLKKLSVVLNGVDAKEMNIVINMAMVMAMVMAMAMDMDMVMDGMVSYNSYY
jgi:Mrp family chromosome partitioning ATPase